MVAPAQNSPAPGATFALVERLNCVTGELLLLVGPERLSPDELAVADAPAEEYVEDEPGFETGATTLEETATPFCCGRIVVADVPFENMPLLKGPANDKLVEVLSALLTLLEPPLALAVTVTVTWFVLVTVVVAGRQVCTDAPVEGDSPLLLLAPVNRDSPLALTGACDPPAAIEVRG